MSTPITSIFNNVITTVAMLAVSLTAAFVVATLLAPRLARTRPGRQAARALLALAVFAGLALVVIKWRLVR